MSERIELAPDTTALKRDHTTESVDAVVLIPAYRPPDCLEDLCETILAGGREVVVVDDGSGPEFGAMFAALPSGVVVLHSAENQGKARALKTGLQYIHEQMPHCAAVVTADADGQHDPADIERVVNHERSRHGSLVLGSRTFEGAVPPRSRFGNTMTRLVFAARTGLRLQDTQTGLRAFSVALIPDLLEIPGERYEYELNVLLWAADTGRDIVEVPIRTIYIDDNASSHFRSVADGLRVYSSLLRFSLSSLVAFALDFALVLVFAQLLSGHVAPGIALLIGVIAARIVSSSVNFLVNRTFVFRSAGQVLASAAGYYALAAVVVGANFSLIYLGTIVVGMQLWLVKLLTEIALFGLSYATQKRVVFQ